MCGRFAASASQEDLADTFDIDELVGPPLLASYNVAPTDPIAAVLERLDAGRRRRKLVDLRWGLVPSWSRSPAGAARMINARVETIAEKPAFRKAFATRRCLIPADGYYEWRDTGRSGPRGRPVKQPWFIHPSDGGLLVMAGLYEFWKAPQGEWWSTATIITTEAVDAVGHLHDRMPMTLPRQAWDDWLDPGFGGSPLELLSVPVLELAYHEVSMAVNKVANNSPDLIEPV